MRIRQQKAAESSIYEVGMKYLKDKISTRTLNGGRICLILRFCCGCVFFIIKKWIDQVNDFRMRRASIHY